MTAKRHITLITNLDYVTISDPRANSRFGVRTYTNALVIVKDEHPLERSAQRCQLRGFSTSGSLPTFDMTIPSIEYSIVGDVQSNVFMIGQENGELKPLFHGARLSFHDGPIVDLIAGVNSDLPLRFEDLGDIEYPELWRRLEQRVASYWEAPAMPVANFVRADQVRYGLGVEKVTK